MELIWQWHLRGITIKFTIMKTYSFLFQTYLFLLITIPSIAANTFKAKVEKATVYLNGAQLFSSHDVSLLQGVNEIIFEGVSPLLQAPSLQASGKGSFTIMEVRFDAIYPEAIAVAKPSAKK